MGVAIVPCAMLLASPASALAAPAKTVARPSMAVLAECSWDRPGHNPFMGDVVAAVDRYADIPPAVRSRLKQRMAQREYDEIVSIRRDRIEGRQHYDSEIRDMHFGAGSLCGTVTRARWSPQMQERGLVYCDSGQCILVPTVCRNVSRIVRRDASGPAAATAPGAAPAEGELAFDPPGAGVPALPANASPPAGGIGGGADSFASRSAEPVPPPLFTVAGAGPSRGTAVGAAPAFELDAAEPFHASAPDLGWPAAPPPGVGPFPTLTTSVTAVPEPGTGLMLAAGLALLHAASRRRANVLDCREPRGLATP